MESNPHEFNHRLSTETKVKVKANANRRISVCMGTAIFPKGDINCHGLRVADLIFAYHFLSLPI